jgi:hypothetical protein
MVKIQKFKKCKAVLTIHGLCFLVWVTDERKVWGKVQYQITPFRGNGSVWKDENFILFDFLEEDMRGV